MPINILMPALSPTMEEGNLAKWFVKEGDDVAAGDVIAEIETDKATMEVEAVDEGKVGRIVVSEGTEGVKINEVIAVLLEEGEDSSEIEVTSKVTPSEIPQKLAQDSGTTTSASPDSNKPEGKKTESVQSKGNRVFASPLARRIAAQNGLDIAKLSGSGPNGRVIKRDVDAAITSGSAAISTSQSKLDSSAVSTDSILKLYEEGSYEIIPHDNMRKTIAKRLTEAKQQVPHFYLTIECEIDALLALRSELNSFAPTNSEGEPEFKLSVNDLVIKAHAMALKAVPDANASWSDSGMVMHKRVDVGVAVAIEGGLITPIIKNAEEKTVSQISIEMKDLAARARNRKLMPHEYQGGSTSVSNLGMFGIKEFSAVINPPHATILAVGAGLKQPVVKEGEIVPATVMNVTLSTDHRAVDGALGARLLQEFKKFIEKPYGMLI